jgi:hypothetical protein
MAASELRELIEHARAAPDCAVYPAAGLPRLPQGLELPSDLSDFYRACGGIDLFQSSRYPISVAAPGQLIPTNVAVLGEKDLGDRSDRWYTIAVTPDRDYLSIDLDPGRSGRCYDSFHEIHGLVGESTVVATSFTDLLERLITNAGRHWYWLEAGFQSLGDAYDD